MIGAYSNGSISITNVTGNIVITAVATARNSVLSSISAVYVQRGTFSIASSIDSLKNSGDLNVVAYWTNNAPPSIIDSEDYTLAKQGGGNLVAGINIIAVSYTVDGVTKSDTFTIDVTDNSLLNTDIVMSTSSITTLYNDILPYDTSKTYSIQYTFSTAPSGATNTLNSVTGPVKSDGIFRNGAILFANSNGNWLYYFASTQYTFTPATGDILTIVHDFVSTNTKVYLNKTLLRSDYIGNGYFTSELAKVVAGKQTKAMTVVPTHLMIIEGDIH